MINLIQGDCLEKMKDIESGSVDMILTDPPYKVTSRGGYTSAGGILLNSEVRKGKVFKENSVTIKEWLPELYRVLKEKSHCYVMCNNKNLYGFLDAVYSSNFNLVKTMVWKKDNKIMSQAYMSQMEFILFLRKGKFKRINNCGVSDVLDFPNVRNKTHPSEKPIDMLSCLIDNSSNVGDLVLDPFMGTGSCALAAKKLNRNFIGIELDEGYFQIAKDRIAAV